ncbi:MAG TPA: hypothetical protein VGR41_09820 [Actinomycetota bacterium]|jgi:hypothetical protein|nr:hypothetical protein [Actinomycetota bacterium]
MRSDIGIARATTRTTLRAGEDGPTLIRWGAIFGGAVLGLALLTLLTTLWLALAYASGVAAVRDNLEWYVGGSAAGSLLVAGILTGYLSGVRGAGAGMLNGWALWGLLLIVTISVGVPSILNLFNLGRVATEAATGVVGLGADTALWASFWTIAGGFFAAGLGGAIGGAMSRGRNVRADIRRSTATDPVVLDEEPPKRVDRDSSSSRAS